MCWAEQMNGCRFGRQVQGTVARPGLFSVLSPGMEVSRRVYHPHHNNSDKERARKECGSSLRTERTWESSKRDKVIRIYMKSANSLSAFPVPTI